MAFPKVSRVAFAAMCVSLAVICVHAADTVLVMRHCARTTTPNVDGGAPGFNYMNNYTDQPWPAWPDNLAPYMCLPNGLTIVQGTGRFLAAQGKLPQPIAITADSVARDEQTATSLAAGLNFPAGSIVTDHAPFSNACPALSHHVVDDAIRANLKAYPLNDTYYNALAMLQKVTGKGVAPLLADIPNVVSGGYLNGGIEAGELEAETLLMELGGNMTVGWGRVSDPMDVYTILNVHSIQRFLGDVVPVVQRNEAASITQHVMNALGNGKPGTQFYVGHDSQMWGLAGTLALRWQAAGLPLLPTLPGSMLRFDRDGDTVTVTYHYPLFTDNSGVLYSTPANLGAVGGNQLSFSQLQSIASAGINPACVVEGPLAEN